MSLNHYNTEIINTIYHQDVTNTLQLKKVQFKKEVIVIQVYTVLQTHATYGYTGCSGNSSNALTQQQINRLHRLSCGTRPLSNSL